MDYNRDSEVDSLYDRLPSLSVPQLPRLFIFFFSSDPVCVLSSLVTPPNRPFCYVNILLLAHSGGGTGHPLALPAIEAITRLCIGRTPSAGGPSVSTDITKS